MKTFLHILAGLLITGGLIVVGIGAYFFYAVEACQFDCAFGGLDAHSPLEYILIIGGVTLVLIGSITTWLASRLRHR